MYTHRSVFKKKDGREALQGVSTFPSEYADFAQIVVGWHGKRHRVDAAVNPFLEIGRPSESHPWYTGQSSFTPIS